MTLWAWLAMAAVVLFLAAFLSAWRKAGRELRAMEQFDQRRVGIGQAQQRPPVTRPVRVK